MSTLNIYDVTIPGTIRSLLALHAILSKAETQAPTLNTTPSALLQSRLVSDMKPFPYQIQQACNTAKGLPFRVANHPEKVLADDTEDETFDQLRARISDTVEYLRSVDREAFEGKEGAEVVLHGHKFTGLGFTTDYYLPNLYFHVTTAYALLRGAGVGIGKLDYLGAIGQKV